METGSEIKTRTKSTITNGKRRNGIFYTLKSSKDYCQYNSGY
jgi:hypothetical protein